MEPAPGAETRCQLELRPMGARAKGGGGGGWFSFMLSGTNTED